MRNVSRAIEFIVKALLSSMAAKPVWRMIWRADRAGRAHEKDTYRIFNRVL
jgi:hypothetical protein